MKVNVDRPILITSGAYVNSEIAAEFGELPPSFLPFGHGRLFQAQISFFKRSSTRIILTIPTSFTPSLADADWLEKNNVELLSTPDGISLGESIRYALIVSGITGPVGILHGDNFLRDFDTSHSDVVGVAPRPASYKWGTLAGINESPAFSDVDPTDVLCGWFSFSSAANLIKGITIANGNFVDGLKLYSDSTPVISMRVDSWLDFGHLQTFYQARSKARTARSFNNIAVSNRTVLKTGDKQQKLVDEANWFDKLPPIMRMFTPKFLGWEGNGYRLAYEHSPTLHELYIFGSLGAASWQRIVGGCFEFLDACREHSPALSKELSGIDMPEQVLHKTSERLEAAAASGLVSMDQEWTINGRHVPKLSVMAAETAEIMRNSDPLLGIMHGDLCFPNMFFDFREQIVKVIDPRGSMRDGEPSIFGDLRYDLAKLNHSLEGYDQILSGKYSCQRYDQNLDIKFYANPATALIKEAALDCNIGGQTLGSASVTATTIHLFLSMLPLHADRPDRQIAFLANALRLYSELGAES